MWNKISYKLMIATCSGAWVVFAIFAYLIQHSHQQQLLADIERSANQISDTIKSSTRHDMLLDRPESVHRIIKTIGAQEGIEKVRIFNKEGEVILSADSIDLGQMVDKQTEACDKCHAADQPLERLSVSERTRIFTGASGKQTFGIINPIYNERSCWESDCHAHEQDQTVLGVLDISMSLEEVEQGLQAGRMRLLVFALIAMGAISLIIYWCVERMVLKPVGKIMEATQKVAAGDMNHAVELEQSDEIGKLADSFNDMMQNLAEAQRQLIQSNKLSSVGRLAAGVAHEINNPLTGVLTYSSFLLKNAEDKPELKEDLQVIVRETIRCRDIVKGLLDFSRQSVSEQRPVHVREIIHNACGIVQHQLSIQKIKIETQLQEDIPLVNADMGQMEQVLVNLLVNAGDAMEENGGTIVIEAGVTPAVENGGEQELPEDQVHIRVTDTGCGIPSDELGKIFDPFFSTKGVKGTGLGLAIVWGILEKHDAQLKVDSKVGKGTTLTILLPITRQVAVI